MKAKTPIELFTEQFMELIRQEGVKYEKAQEQAFLNTAKVLAVIYLSRSAQSGYSFRLPKSASSFFDELEVKLYDIYQVYTTNAVKLSQLKNVKVLNKMVEVPSLKTWWSRKVQEITTKQRIAKYTQMFKMEMEANLAQGIVKTQSVNDFIRDIKIYLKRPYDNLDPKVRRTWTANRLGKNYKPGTGRAKSAFANMNRFGKSEMIEAYRRADHYIWRNDKSVVGIEVYLNPAHPIEDSCDFLVGAYPKGYVFTGFHPRCICLTRPILRGGAVGKVPNAATEYMNGDGKKWYGKLPFYTENLKYWK